MSGSCEVYLAPSDIFRKPFLSLFFPEESDAEDLCGRGSKRYGRGASDAGGELHVCAHARGMPATLQYTAHLRRTGTARSRAQSLFFHCATATSPLQKFIFRGVSQ